ncbi:DUF998 domain-containing protein [Microbacterium sp. JB110]|uniref:DUF998 domain-containing protein n=1 Tax=Microbacterium sp. JB110 TaxID=2024477 RepID=UPI00097F0996|nr:DUF998 domain-containing protein [Microbacterium sp. JB110]SJM53790.1 ABC transporter, permease protein (putative) [Frigoribacterium sp. JB110]
MDRIERKLRALTKALWMTAACFAIGTAGGVAALWGVDRPLVGDGSVMLSAAFVSGVVAGVAFVISAVTHRRDETASMPRWQTAVSHVSTVAVAAAVVGVTALGVLLAGEVLAVGLQGIELSALGGGVLTGAAASVGGHLAFRAGIDLRTRDLAALLFAFLIVGTLFAMMTATDPAWWERSFSRLGIGGGAWAFNGTLVVAGLLVATVGSYIGRDLHRLLGDGPLNRIAVVVAAWTGCGAALAAVGMLPVDRAPLPHAIAAFAALALVVVAAIVTSRAVPKRPPLLRFATVGLVALSAAATLLTFAFHTLSVTALESVVIGLLLLWMSTLAQVLDIIAPHASRPSGRRSPLRA